jgi:hypothetical protein
MRRALPPGVTAMPGQQMPGMPTDGEHDDSGRSNGMYL